MACTFASKISGAVGNNTWSAQKSGVQKHTPGDHHESAVNKDSLFGVYFCTPAGVHFCTPNFWREREKNERARKSRTPDDEFLVCQV